MINRGIADPPRAAGINGVSAELQRTVKNVLVQLAPPLGGLSRLETGAALELLERAESMELTATLTADRGELLLDFWEPSDPTLTELLAMWGMTLPDLGIDPEQNAWRRMETRRRN